MANSLGGPDRPSENVDPWYTAREAYDKFMEGEVFKRHQNDRGILPEGTDVDDLNLGTTLGTHTLSVGLMATYKNLPFIPTQNAAFMVFRGASSNSVVHMMISHNTFMWREKPFTVGSGWGIWRKVMDHLAVGKAETFPPLTRSSDINNLPSGFHPVIYSEVARGLGLPYRLGTLEVREIFPTIKVQTYRTDFGSIMTTSGVYQEWMRGMDSDRNWLPDFELTFSSTTSNASGMSNSNGPVYAPQGAVWLSKTKAAYSKNADTPVRPYSTMKSFALYVARKTITNAFLDSLVTVTVEDVDPGGSGGITFNVGDQISYRDLFYSMMLPSSNWATNIVARAVGDILPGTGTGYSKFLTAMRNTADSLGWSGYVISNPHGIGSVNALSANMMCSLVFELAPDTSARRFMSTMNRTITFHGPNARTQDLEQNFDRMGDVQFPEFEYGKGGSLDSTYNCYVMGWEDRTGDLHALAVLGSNAKQRGSDMRQMIDLVKNAMDQQYMVL